RPRPRRPRRPRRILIRPRDRGRVQRLPAALGPAGADRRADPAAHRGDAEAAGRLLRPLWQARVPALLGRPSDQLPDLARTTDRWSGAAGPARLAGAAQFPDPDRRRAARRRHFSRRGAPGAGAVPTLAPLCGAQPRPCLQPLLYPPLTRSRRDPQFPPPQLRLVIAAAAP